MNNTLKTSLVLCDLDHLLLGTDGNLPQVLRDVMQLFSSRGGRLTVFSQRSPKAVRTILGSVRLAAPALVCGGTLAYQFATGTGQPLCSFAGREELSAFLSQCRVLINLLPNTPETVGIINQQLLEKLPDGAYLLNLARGVHVVEDDLLAALDSGKVKGAMLDVFNREPLPPESPLWQHPRVTITPHVAAITRPAEAVEYISRTIAQLEKGERVCGQVDRARGY